MEIYLSKFAGFCDGVKRAYEIVNDLDMEKVRKPVCILGALVHNPEVVKKISAKGIKKIELDFLINAKKGEIGTLIIAAHGVGYPIFEIAREKGVDIIDTTCPKVIKVQRLAQVFSKRGYEIVLIGDREHKEVEGINAWGEGKAKIISCGEDLDDLNFLDNDKIVVLSQTTQSEEFFNQVVEKIKNKFSKAEIISTICHATHERQEEIRRLAKENEVVIVIGSEISANSKRLFEIASSINAKTYFIETADLIDEEWFSGIETVAVTAGASTPSWIIEDVLKKIGNI